jgi:hypothetical protein
MLRAREDVAGLRLQDAVDRLERCMFTSTGSISRLESMPEPPSDRRRRALAAALLFVYGLDPRPFKVGADDLPPAVYAELASVRLLLGNRAGGDAGFDVTAGYPHTVEVAA